MTINVRQKFRTLFKMPRRGRRQRGEVWGGGITLPIQLGRLKKHRKLPDGAPPENWFGAFRAQQNASLTGKNAKMMNCDHLLIDARHILALNRDKFSTGFEIRDKSASWMTSYFFGTGLQNSGLSRTIRDRWSPYFNSWNTQNTAEWVDQWHQSPKC